MALEDCTEFVQKLLMKIMKAKKIVSFVQGLDEFFIAVSAVAINKISFFSHYSKELKKVLKNSTKHTRILF